MGDKVMQIEQDAMLSILGFEKRNILSYNRERGNSWTMFSMVAIRRGWIRIT